MNRNNFLPQLALALVLIFVAAFAGQLRKWQKHWRYARSVTIGTAKPFVNPPNDDFDKKGCRGAAGMGIFVRFRADTPEERIQSIVKRLNDRVEDEIESVKGLEVIEDEDGRDADTVVAEYCKLPEVEYAEPNDEIVLEDEVSRAEPVLPNDPRFGDQWALANDGQRGGKEGADISAMRAWTVTKGSDKVVVAVLDSGVDYTHQDLVNNIWIRPQNIRQYEDRNLGTVNDIHGYNAVDNSGDPMDENGHGTHCAGIIGAEGGNDLGITGVNWNVQIMPLKFMNAGGFGDTKDAIECINYVIDRKHAGVNVRVISASWGSTHKSRALEDVIRKAYEAGILFVAASGNSAVDTDRTPHYPASYNVGNIISVAALDRSDELASFSNYGAKSVHIAAPGKEILSTWLNNDFEEHSGTSMATPVVAGIAALALSMDPGLSVDELHEKLMKSVDKLESLKGKVATGGRISAAKAVGAD